MSLLSDVEQNSRRLDVYVGKEHVGSLERDGAKGSVFAYLPDAQPDGFASLLMPVRLESYTSKTSLIPALQQNLPEGFLRRQLTERFGKILATDDFLLLALTGSDAIGRQRIVPSGFDPDWIQTPQTNVDELMLSQSDTQFNSLLNESLRYGISGALPKVLTSNPTTLHSERWILKMGGSSLPSLAVNEYFTMKAASAAGFDTPNFRLSIDASVFAVERFDRDGDGNALGFEDFCALSALPPERKYSGTMERVLKVIDAFTLDACKTKAKETMISAQLFAMAAGNTDAHLKNFGLLYSHPQNVRLAPIFDMVTTKVYPSFRNDVSAISIAGKKMNGVDKTFVRFAQDRTGISGRGLREMTGRILNGLDSTSTDLVTYAKEHPEHREVCLAMAAEWQSGMKRIEALAHGTVSFGKKESQLHAAPVREEDLIPQPLQPLPHPKC